MELPCGAGPAGNLREAPELSASVVGRATARADNSAPGFRLDL
jgi:hypothetical protein